MHAFLPPTMFHKNVASTVTTARPQTASHNLGPRKLRKTRSIPDMISLTAQDSATPSSQVSTAALTGRAHSHSVSAADIERFTTVNARYNPPPRRGDIFAEVMEWDPPSSATSSRINLADSTSMNPYDHPHAAPNFVAHPFGPGVSFDSPSRKPTMDYLPMPRLLREMQSFESGLTARQVDPIITGGRDSPFGTGESQELDADRPSSALRLYVAATSTYDSLPEIHVAPASSEPTFSPAPETAMLSRYSTDVFDVLQTYRGLPLLDRLVPESEETTVIKMSLSADETAAPRDDPRFVIWGELFPDREEEYSASHDSLTDLSSSVRGSTMSRKRSTRSGKSKATEPPNVRLSVSGEPPQKVLIAATIERWIAQLTSDLNYDELLDFFLTYRTYISAVDLCHLLICRFHWALQQPSSSQDETVRRIVRVRTFVAIRYWLLTFFGVDFLSNRELRLLVADWLNTLVRDPVLKKNTDGLVCFTAS